MYEEYDSTRLRPLFPGFAVETAFAGALDAALDGVFAIVRDVIVCFVSQGRKRAFLIRTYVNPTQRAQIIMARKIDTYLTSTHIARKTCSQKEK
jgi:hypothetical protein